MSDIPNPFAIIFVFAIIVFMAVGGFSVIAPSFVTTDKQGNEYLNGVEIPAKPSLPTLSLGNYRGNQSAGATWAFGPDIIYVPKDSKLSMFIPPKYCFPWYGRASILGSGPIEGFQFERDGQYFFDAIPYKNNEPISDSSGNLINQNGILTVQQIIEYTGDAAIPHGGSTADANFIIDNGNPQYMAYASFSPLPGASNMAQSWSQYGGFTLSMYGNAYQAPSWTTQLVTFFVFLGDLILYAIDALVYIVAMAGVMTALLGIYPAVGETVLILVAILLVGSIIMFIRGSGGGGSK